MLRGRYDKIRNAWHRDWNTQNTAVTEGTVLQATDVFESVRDSHRDCAIVGEG